MKKGRAYLFGIHNIAAKGLAPKSLNFRYRDEYAEFGTRCDHARAHTLSCIHLLTREGSANRVYRFFVFRFSLSPCIVPAMVIMMVISLYYSTVVNEDFKVSADLGNYSFILSPSGSPGSVGESAPAPIPAPDVGIPIPIPIPVPLPFPSSGEQLENNTYTYMCPEVEAFVTCFFSSHANIFVFIYSSICRSIDQSLYDDFCLRVCVSSGQPTQMQTRWGLPFWTCCHFRQRTACRSFQRATISVRHGFRIDSLCDNKLSHLLSRHMMWL